MSFISYALIYAYLLTRPVTCPGAQVGNGTQPVPTLTGSVVEYGYEPNDLVYTANGTSEYYNQIYPST